MASMYNVHFFFQIIPHKMHGGGRYHVLFLGVLCIQLCQVISHWSRTCTPEVRREGPHSQGLCGNQIGEVMQLICGTRGYTERIVKRSEDGDEEDEIGEFITHSDTGMLG